MGQWHVNQGWNRNLLAHLSGGPRYQLDVYVVAQFRFFYPDESRQWTTAEQAAWKGRYAELAYRTWSHKWTLVSDISCEPLDVQRGNIQMPTARVRVHVADVENPSVRLPMNQRLYLVKVYRRPPSGEPRGRQHAQAIEPSRATVRDAGAEALPPGAALAELYEDSLEFTANPIEGHQQLVSMHELGHMLGLMHPNDAAPGCELNRSADLCYGEPFSSEANSIMGRGREIRPADYSVFVHIMSRLVQRAPQAGLSALLGATHPVMWSVPGTMSTYCEGQYVGRALSDRGRVTGARGRQPASYGLG